MKLLFVMDPLENVHIHEDTTFAFMLAAQARGHELHTCGQGELSARADTAMAVTRRVTVRREEGNHCAINEPNVVALDSFDVVFQRTDPPFDIDYLHACHILELAEERGTLVVNKPAGLRLANEKLFALHFPDVIPDTLVTSVKQEIFDFASEYAGRCVIKPVDGHGGEAVFVVDLDDGNVNALVEVMTNHGQRRIICQEYLPEAKRGDKRILLLDGKPLGAILRVPPEGEHRGNIHVGGTVEKAELTDRDREICDTVAPRLRAAGLWFVGLDVIGGKLTEINVTSPTGIQEMSRFDGVDGSDLVMQWVENKAS